VGASALGQAVSIALVEDQRVVIDGARSWVAADPPGRVVIAAVGSSIEEAMAGPGRQADVLVLDLELGKEMMTGRVAELSDAEYRVIVFSIHVEPLIVQAIMKAGACAFLVHVENRAGLTR
jgi:two-component system, NarL family, nitrate/nitrite response regulator NarL